MCRSDPHTPVASTRTIASVAASSSGSGRSSTRTSPGAWKVTARIDGEPYRPRSKVSEWPGSALLVTTGEGRHGRQLEGGPDHGLLDRDRARDRRAPVEERPQR